MYIQYVQGIFKAFRSQDNHLNENILTHRNYYCYAIMTMSRRRRVDKWSDVLRLLLMSPRQLPNYSFASMLA